MGHILQLLIMKELQQKRGDERKNDILEIHLAEPGGWGRVGVPGPKPHVYPMTTIPWRHPAVKTQIRACPFLANTRLSKHPAESFGWFSSKLGQKGMVVSLRCDSGGFFR
jgi:hypothetical protein